MPAIKLGSISTSHQEECPGCHGYEAWLWAKLSLGSPHRTPPVLTAQPGESPGHGGALGLPESRGGVPSNVSIHRGLSGAYMASGQQRWPKVEEGLATEEWPSRRRQVLLGRAHPYLPGSAEGSRGAVAVSPMAAKTWPETAASGSSFQAGGESPQQAPRNLRLGCAFSDFSVCSCSV